jgi:flagellar biosynthesis chaperone FliJ
VLPELVKKGKNGHRKVAYLEFIPVLIEAVKEQQETISRLSDRINDLEKSLKIERTIATADIPLR